MSLLADAFPVTDAFQRQVVDAGLRPAMVVLVAFLVTFACVRAVTHAIRRGSGDFHDLAVRGVHLHHLVPGILLLLATGFVAIGVDPHVPHVLWWLLPTAFGVGAALTLDEFALWLNLKDVYWTTKGRSSIDAIIVAAAIVAIFAVGGRFWVEVIRQASPLGSGLIVAYHALSLLLAAICLVKGRYVVAAVSLILWPVGLVGAMIPTRRGSFRERHRADEAGDGELGRRHPGGARPRARRGSAPPAE